MIMPQFGSLNYLKIVSSPIEDILYLKTFKEGIDTQLLIIVKPKYDKEVILKFAEEHIPLGVMYKVIEVTDYLEQQDETIKKLENAIQELIVNFFKSPCDNNNKDYEVLNKFLNEELNINCIEVDVDVENGKNVT